MRLFQNPQHGLQIVPPAQDLSFGSNHGIHALPRPQLGAFFNAVKRIFGGAAKHCKHREIAERRNPIVAPFARRHHPPVKPQNCTQLAAIKVDLLGQVI